jgi:hypothetical protein
MEGGGQGGALAGEDYEAGGAFSPLGLLCVVDKVSSGPGELDLQRRVLVRHEGNLLLQVIWTLQEVMLRLLRLLVWCMARSIEDDVEEEDPEELRTALRGLCRPEGLGLGGSFLGKTTLAPR